MVLVENYPNVRPRSPGTSRLLSNSHVLESPVLTRFASRMARSASPSGGPVPIVVPLNMDVASGRATPPSGASASACPLWMRLEARNGVSSHSSASFIDGNWRDTSTSDDSDRAKSKVGVFAFPGPQKTDSVFPESVVQQPLQVLEDTSSKCVASSQCMARLWGGGRGGQCSRAMVGSSDYCMLHHKEVEKTGLPTHGRIDGPIPLGKVRAFETMARKGGWAMPGIVEVCRPQASTVSATKLRGAIATTVPKETKTKTEPQRRRLRSRSPLSVCCPWLIESPSRSQRDVLGMLTPPLGGKAAAIGVVSKRASSAAINDWRVLQLQQENGGGIKDLLASLVNRPAPPLLFPVAKTSRARSSPEKPVAEARASTAQRSRGQGISEKASAQTRNTAATPLRAHQKSPAYDLSPVSESDPPNIVGTQGAVVPHIELCPAPPLRPTGGGVVEQVVSLSDIMMDKDRAADSHRQHSEERATPPKMASVKSPERTLSSAFSGCKDAGLSVAEMLPLIPEMGFNDESCVESCPDRRGSPASAFTPEFAVNVATSHVVDLSLPQTLDLAVKHFRLRSKSPSCLLTHACESVSQRSASAGSLILVSAGCVAKRNRLRGKSPSSALTQGFANNATTDADVLPPTAPEQACCGNAFVDAAATGLPSACPEPEDVRLHCQDSSGGSAEAGRTAKRFRLRSKSRLHCQDSSGDSAEAGRTAKRFRLRSKSRLHCQDPSGDSAEAGRTAKRFRLPSKRPEPADFDLQSLGVCTQVLEDARAAAAKAKKARLGTPRNLSPVKKAKAKKARLGTPRNLSPVKMPSPALSSSSPSSGDSWTSPLDSISPATSLSSSCFSFSDVGPWRGRRPASFRGTPASAPKTAQHWTLAWSHARRLSVEARTPRTHCERSKSPASLVVGWQSPPAKGGNKAQTPRQGKTIPAVVALTGKNGRSGGRNVKLKAIDRKLQQKSQQKQR